MTADRFVLPRVAVAILSLTLLCPAGLHAQSAATGAPHVPTIDELVELGSVGAATLSPDGRWVAYEESGADWERDAFVTQLFVADTSTGTVTQLTRGKESAGDIEWSPDSRWITFLRNVDGKGQVHAIRPDGGEALVLSKHDESVANHEWTPDGTTIVLAAPEGEDAAAKARKESLGDFTVVRKDYRYAQLWTLTVAEALQAPAKARQRTKGTERHVGAFDVAPDGRRVAFHASRTPDLVDSGSSDVFLLDLGTDIVSPLVTQPGPDTNPRWSPDGSRIAFQSAMGEPRFFHANGRVAVVPAAGGAPVSVTDRLDEDAQLAGWTPTGLYVTALQKTASHLFRVDPAAGTVTRVSMPDALAMQGASSAPTDRAWPTWRDRRPRCRRCTPPPSPASSRKHGRRARPGWRTGHLAHVRWSAGRARTVK